MTDADALPTIDVESLSVQLEAEPDNIQLIDVREPHELEIAQLPQFTNLPLSQFQTWADGIQQRFDPHAETIVMCHLGMRSAQMCQWLISQGFTNVKNLSGGIDAYSRRIDQTVPIY